MAGAYRYGPAWENRLAPSIADLIARAGDIQARGVTDAAAAQAQGAQASGNAWAGAVQNIGNTFAAIPQQMQRARQQQEEARVRSQQADIQGLQLQQAQRADAGNRTLASAMKTSVDPSTQPQGPDLSQPNGTVPSLPNFLKPDDNGVATWDVDGLSKYMALKGYGDLNPTFVKDVNTLNEVVRAEASARTKTIQHLADVSYRSGNDPVIARELIRTLRANKFYPEDTLNQIEGAVGTPAFAKIVDGLRTPTKATVLKPGDVAFDEATNERIPGMNVPEKPPVPTRASLAADLSSPDPDVRAKAKTAIEALQAPTKRTESEQALDAYAKSIGKPDATALTYDDRQTFEKNKAAITASAQFQNHVNERNYDNAHPAPEKPKKQDDLEQEYRTVLARGLSSRSGGLGLEDSKVQQANHLMALLDQSFDAKTGNYNIPKVQQTELALGLARMMSPNGTVGIQLEKEINQATALGDLNKAITYITGTPQNGSTQDVVKMFRDSIQRQGETALQNREGEMAYLRGLAPTSLAEDRRKALEATSLNPLRQSRVIKNSSTGERKIQVSVDGGATWK